MSWPKRIRNIAASQLNAIKDRLDRIDEESAMETLERVGARAAAEQELSDALHETAPRPLRSPAEIATGAQARPVQTGARPTAQTAAAAQTPLSRSYRILGLSDGAPLPEVEVRYKELAARSDPTRFEPGSADEANARDILKRVEDAYKALAEALDPAAGRFDKLEL
ncbi:MAG: hypothetical protein NT029_14120 [Armatimonadetes bacterium]|nr:hypothetical protein [Armatimonadota bacterium]